MYAYDIEGFHPLYRGTWFPTWIGKCLPWRSRVSIRYIAVLGFQPRTKSEGGEASSLVSIRYIAVLGFQPGSRVEEEPHMKRFHPLYRGTWFPTFAP